MDKPLDNLQWLICHETKPSQTKPNFTQIKKFYEMNVDFIQIWKDMKQT